MMCSLVPRVVLYCAGSCTSRGGDYVTAGPICLTFQGNQSPWVVIYKMSWTCMQVWKGLWVLPAVTGFCLLLLVTHEGLTDFCRLMGTEITEKVTIFV